MGASKYTSNHSWVNQALESCFGRRLLLITEWLNMFRWAVRRNLLHPNLTLSCWSSVCWWFVIGGYWCYLEQAPWVGFANSVRSPSYYVFQEANAAVKTLSPLLSQLQTSELEWVGGWHIDPRTNTTVSNTPPEIWQRGQVASNFSIGGAVVSNISVRNLGSANSGLPEDVLLCHFTVLPGRTAPGADPPAKLASDGRSTASYFALFNGLVPDQPDNAHGAGAALGQVEITITLGPTVLSLREWSGGGSSGWTAQTVSTGGARGDRTVRVAVGGGVARFYQAITASVA
jgi:hypothetical protein